MAIYDSIIIGAGHNGLVTAACLAKAGKKVLVLERRPIVGGIAVTEEIVSGFKFSSCAHLAGSLSSSRRDRVVLPAPEGEDSTSIKPRL